MSKTKAWIHAFRLRTLPLSLSSIFLGSLIAAAHHLFNWTVFILAVLTTLFLQILSNLANDLGDSLSGADNADRIGPERAVQSGVISVRDMKRMVVVFVVLSLFTGIWLVYEGTKYIDLNSGLIMLVLGIAAIGAAINYTVGKNPYGYSGFGDIFVFLFFGLTGVLGVYFLHAGSVPLDLLLPATSVGLLSVGVLNLNNLRDRENDARTGKRTLVVKMGPRKAIIYHVTILVLAFFAALLYASMNWSSPWQLIFLVVLPLLVLNSKTVVMHQKPANLDPELKKLALTTLLFSLTFGLGMLF
ncbi:MAG: 1,4-dihydroxy-2-naphthoate polyprenyltransferase [Marinifilaceae bacterium]